MSVRLSGPPRRRGRPPFDRGLLLRRARRILRELGLARSELSLVLLDDAGIAELNRRYRGREGPTDVLSFSLLEGRYPEFRGALLGDVVIGIDTAARNAADRGVSLDEELLRLVVHGVLHLLGHDHEEPAEARRMRAAERRLLARLAA